MKNKQLTKNRPPRFRNWSGVWRQNDVMNKTLAKLSKDERSLLLYLECCLVDYGGKTDSRRMNTQDRLTIDVWVGEGFITWDRICFADVEQNLNKPYVVGFSEKAWELALAERRERAQRVFNNRTWKMTKELDLE